MTQLFEAVRGFDGRRHALVLSGGGAEGAYEIGVLAGLAQGTGGTTDRRPLRSNIFCGNSIGAFHAAYLSCHQVAGDLRSPARDLVRIWRHYVAHSQHHPGRGIFRLRGFPPCIEWRSLALSDPVRCAVEFMASGTFWARLASKQVRLFLAGNGHPIERALGAIRLDALFDDRPFRRLLRQTIQLQALARQSAFLAVGLTHFVRGTPRILFKEEITDIFGLGAFEASIAVPGMLPARWLAGQPYMDGGLSMTTPFLPAVVAGAEVLHVVRAWPPIHQLPPATPSTFETVYRLLRILMFNNVFDNLHSLDGVAEAVQDFIEAEREWNLAKRGEPVSRGGERWHKAVENWSAFDGRGTDIHFYSLRGGRSSAASFLDFGLDHIDRLMKRGFQDVVEHDCTREGCLLNGAEPRPAAGEPA